MQIKKVSDSSVIDSYFETMLKFQEKRSDDTLRKEAWLSGAGKGLAEALGASDDLAKAVAKGDDVAAAAAKSAVKQGDAMFGAARGTVKKLSLPKSFVGAFGSNAGGAATKKIQGLGRELQTAMQAGKNSDADMIPIVAKYVQDGDPKAVWKAIKSGDYSTFRSADEVADATRGAGKVDDAAKAVEETRRGMGSAGKRMAYTAGDKADILKHKDKIRKTLGEVEQAARAFERSGGKDASALADVYKAADNIFPKSLRNNVKHSIEQLYFSGKFAERNSQNMSRMVNQVQNISGTQTAGRDINNIIQYFEGSQRSLGKVIGGFQGSITRLESSASSAVKLIDDADVAVRTGDDVLRTGDDVVKQTVRQGDQSQVFSPVINNYPPGGSTIGHAGQNTLEIALKEQKEVFEALLLKLDELKVGGKISPEDHMRILQRLENVGNTHIHMADLIKNLGKLGGKQASKWNKGWLKWVLGAGIVGGGIWAANKAGLFDGGGGPGPGPVPKPPETHGGKDPPAVKEAVTAATTGDWQTVAQLLADAEASGNTALLSAMLNKLKRVYRAPFYVKLVPPFTTDEGIDLHYAFVRRVRGGPNPADPFVVESVRAGLDDLKGAGGVYNVKLVEQSGDAQRAINEAFTAAAGYGLAERGAFGGRGLGRRRSRRLTRGRRVRGLPGQGYAGSGKRRMGRDIRRRRREAFKGNRLANERFDMLMKYSAISSTDLSQNRLERFDILRKIAEEVSNSTNNDTIYDDSELFKGADDVSKAYYKDAVTDLNNSDQYLRSYFTGLKGLYDEKAETPKGDYKSLYNVHDETGVDLIHSAHPKAVVVLDSIGRGGLVENGLEQKRQTHGVALSAPTGNYRANYAWVRNALEKTSM